jgi:hypothetical protein
VKVSPVSGHFIFHGFAVSGSRFAEGGAIRRSSSKKLKLKVILSTLSSA